MTVVARDVGCSRVARAKRRSAGRSIPGRGMRGWRGETSPGPVSLLDLPEHGEYPQAPMQVKSGDVERGHLTPRHRVSCQIDPVGPQSVQGLGGERETQRLVRRRCVSQMGAALSGGGALGDVGDPPCARVRSLGFRQPAQNVAAPRLSARRLTTLTRPSCRLLVEDRLRPAPYQPTNFMRITASAEPSRARGCSC